MMFHLSFGYKQNLNFIHQPFLTSKIIHPATYGLDVFL